MVVTGSLRRPYTSRIYAIFHLCMKSNALEKFTNSRAASRFFGTYFFDDSTDSQTLKSWIDSSKSHPRNFFDFRLDKIEKHGITNFSFYKSKG